MSRVKCQIRNGNRFCIFCDYSFLSINFKITQTSVGRIHTYQKYDEDFVPIAIGSCSFSKILNSKFNITDTLPNFTKRFIVVVLFSRVWRVEQISQVHLVASGFQDKRTRNFSSFQNAAHPSVFNMLLSYVTVSRNVLDKRPIYIYNVHVHLSRYARGSDKYLLQPKRQRYTRSKHTWYPILPSCFPLFGIESIGSICHWIGFVSLFLRE